MGEFWENVQLLPEGSYFKDGGHIVLLRIIWTNHSTARCFQAPL